MFRSAGALLVVAVFALGALASNSLIRNFKFGSVDATTGLPPLSIISYNQLEDYGGYKYCAYGSANGFVYAAPGQKYSVPLKAGYIYQISLGGGMGGQGGWGEMASLGDYSRAWPGDMKIAANVSGFLDLRSGANTTLTFVMGGDGRAGQDGEWKFGDRASTAHGGGGGLGYGNGASGGDDGVGRSKVTIGWGRFSYTQVTMSWAGGGGGGGGGGSAAWLGTEQTSANLIASAQGSPGSHGGMTIALWGQTSGGASGGAGGGTTVNKLVGIKDVPAVTKNSRSFENYDDTSGILLVNRFAVKESANIPKYTIKFDTAGGSSVPDQTVWADNQGKATEPTARPTREGYVFHGWTTQANGAGAYFDFENTNVTASNTKNGVLTLYAKWTYVGRQIDITKSSWIPAELLTNVNETTKTSSSSQPSHGYSNNEGHDGVTLSKGSIYKVVMQGGRSGAAHGGGSGNMEDGQIQYGQQAYGYLDLRVADSDLKVYYDVGGNAGNATSNVGSIGGDGYGGTFDKTPIYSTNGETVASGGNGGGGGGGTTALYIGSATSKDGRDILMMAKGGKGGDGTDYNGVPGGKGGVAGGPGDTSIVKLPNCEPGNNNIYYGDNAKNGGFIKIFRMDNSTAGYNTLNVKFHGNGAEDYQTTVTYGAFLESHTVSRAGFVFGGWYDDVALTHQFGFAFTQVYANLDLYAKWTATTLGQHKITYNSNGGTALEPELLVTAGQDLSLVLKTPMKEGYTFAGWFTNAGLTTPVPDTMPDTDMTLYAKWSTGNDDALKTLFTIQFKTGTGATPGDYEKVVEAGVTYWPPETPTRPGYTFVCWGDSESDTYTEVPSVQLTTFTNNRTIWAKWKTASKPQHKITFDSKGGAAVTEMTYVEEGYELWSLPMTSKEPSDGKKWILDDWYFDSACTEGNAFYDKELPFVMPNHDVTLYAKWVEAPSGSEPGGPTTGGERQEGQIKITFHTQGGTPSDSFVYADPGVKTPPENPGKDGYTFGGWFKDSAGTTAMNWESPITEDIELYAKWTPNKHSISYSAQGGTPAPQGKTDIQFGTDISGASYLPTISKDGYDFGGWFEDSACATAAPSTMPDRDLTLYPKFTAHKYLVTFNLNGGTGAASMQVGFESILNDVLPSPVRAGYSFGGWFTNSGMTTPAPEKMPMNDLPLWAKWSKAHSITFVADVADILGDSETTFDDWTIVSVGAPLSPLPELYKDGYYFLGWYTNAGLTNAVPATMPDNDLTLYPKWKVAPPTGVTVLDPTATLKFHTNYTGGQADWETEVAVDTLSSGQKPNIFRSGYTLAGWYLDQGLTKEFDWDSGDLEAGKTYELWAKWEAVASSAQHRIIFNPNGGTINDSTANVVWTDVAEGYEIAGLPQPTKDGFTFAGWTKTKDDLTTVFNTPATMGNTDLTLYAGWVEGDQPIDQPPPPIDPNKPAEEKQCTITFDTNGGDKANWTRTVNPGEYWQPDGPAKLGSHFIGWKDKNGKILADGESIVVAEGDTELTFTAQWEVNTNQVTFETNGGDAIAPKSVAYGTALGELPTPKKDGFDFGGWYSDAACTVEAPVTMPDYGITLYAKWKDTVTDTDSESNLKKILIIVAIVLAVLLVAASVAYIVWRKIRKKRLKAAAKKAIDEAKQSLAHTVVDVKEYKAGKEDLTTAMDSAKSTNAKIEDAVVKDGKVKKKKK